MIARRALLSAAALLAAAGALAQRTPDAPRLVGNSPPTTPVPAPPVPRPITDDVRRSRNYPEQPPVIPHTIDGYQITLRTNQCLTCHARQFIEGSGAPMISVTHFMDRDGQVLADVDTAALLLQRLPRVADRCAAAGAQHVPRRAGRGSMRALFGWLGRVWTVVRSPATSLSLGFLTLGGFACGLVFWGAFNTALEFANTETFCLSCHEMRSNVYQELSRTVHFSNRSGVRAVCSDCHVPHNWTDKIARKMQASKEVWGHLFGTIATRQKFLDHRLELAEHEWARLKANDSLECRNCHTAPAMDLTKQTERAARIHQRYLMSGRTHLHRLPSRHRA